MVTRDLLRLVLLVMGSGMLLLSELYLLRRLMDWFDYFAWGILAIVLPVLGPFLVIACRPGEPRLAQAPEGLPATHPRRLRVDDSSVSSR